MSEDKGYCEICGYEWSPEPRPRYCPRCDFPTDSDQPDQPTNTTSMSNQNEGPACGHCSKTLTLENSRMSPELFLCDDCSLALYRGIGASPPHLRAQSPEEALERYANEHAGEFAEAASASPPRLPMSDAAKLVFDFANALNRAYLEELRQLP